MEVYHNFNCFAILTILYFITLELPYGAFSVSNKSSARPTHSSDITTASTNNVEKIYHLLRHGYPSLFAKNNKKVPLIGGYHPDTYSSSYSSLGEEEEESSQHNFPQRFKPFLSRNKKRKLASNKLNHHTRKSKLSDILIILSRNNKTGNTSRPYASPQTSGYPFAPVRHLISAKDRETNQTEIERINQNAPTVHTVESVKKSRYNVSVVLKGRITQSDRIETLPTAISSKKGYYAQQTNKEKETKKHSNDDLFPVAFLINSQLQQEPPGISEKLMLHKEKRTGGYLGGSTLRPANNRKVRFSESMSGNLPALSTHYESRYNPQAQKMDASLDLTTLYYETNTGTHSPESTIIPPTTSPTSPEESYGADNDTTTTEEDKTELYNQTAGTIALRGKCNDTIQCFGEHVECRIGICKCQLGYLPRVDNGELCGEASAHHVEVPTTDPTMIGVVVGLALMSVTLCIVLRLFAKARFRENRTIFNTPNPRLMNVSLLKGSKTLLRGNSAGGQRSRRGSQASMASGQIDGESPVNSGNDGNGAASGAGSSHPHRIKPSRTLSTDTTNQEGTPTSSRPAGAGSRSKFRQDSVASNV